MEEKDIAIKKFKKRYAAFRTIGLIFALAIIIFVLVTVLTSESFDTSVIVACSIFVGYIVIFGILMTISDAKRNNIIHKYYGEVNETDIEKAKSLLGKMHIIDKNEYDFYDELYCDNEEVVISQALKLLAKGKKVHVDLYKTIKTIEQTIKDHKEKFTDEGFNDFIFELALLLENNLCDI